MPSAPSNRLRVYIDNGRQVWTPVDVQVPPGFTDVERAQLLAKSLRGILEAVEDEIPEGASGV